MNAGRRLQQHWRWNGRPLRVRIYRIMGLGGAWCINWDRWHPRGGWTHWRSYGGSGELRDVIARYRDYADEWRGIQ